MLSADAYAASIAVGRSTRSERELRAARIAEDGGGPFGRAEPLRLHRPYNSRVKSYQRGKGALYGAPFCYLQPVNRTLKAYVASALGFSEIGRSAYYSLLLPAIEAAGYVVLDPWKLTSSATLSKALRAPAGPLRRRRWSQVNIVIGRNNCVAIEECDVLVAVLDGSDIDSGTAAEIGYAAGIGKPVIGYRNDLRPAGDNEGSVVNLQVEYFIRKSGGRIVPDLVSLERVLRARTRRDA